jgi:hypothetical protein
MNLLPIGGLDVHLRGMGCGRKRLLPKQGSGRGVYLADQVPRPVQKVEVPSFGAGKPVYPDAHPREAVICYSDGAVGIMGDLRRSVCHKHPVIPPSADVCHGASPLEEIPAATQVDELGPRRRVKRGEKLAGMRRKVNRHDRQHAVQQALGQQRRAVRRGLQEYGVASNQPVRSPRPVYDNRLRPQRSHKRAVKGRKVRFDPVDHGVRVKYPQGIGRRIQTGPYGINPVQIHPFQHPLAVNRELCQDTAAEAYQAGLRPLPPE